MPDVQRPGNRILEMLSAADFQRISEHIEPVTLETGQVVCEPGETVQHAHFPVSSILSSVIVLEGGLTVEAATIGNEGMSGISLLVDSRASPYRILQQHRGTTVRIQAAVFKQVLNGSAALRELLERYALTLIQQGAQNAACNQHHTLEERMSRWLLATSDRLGWDEFNLTQEFLAEMLGVYRQSVNLAARQLQTAGLISSRRGRVKILDREGLEQTCCECYQITKNTYDRLMQLSTG